MARRLALLGLLVVGTGAAIVLIASEFAIEKLSTVEKLGEELEENGAERDGNTIGRAA